MVRTIVAIGVAVCVLVLTGCGAGDGGEGGNAGVTDAGATTYQRYCFSCHQAGVAGAPRIGDVEAWAPRIAKGPEALLTSTIQGVAPGMPPRGLCLQCTDEDLAAAIRHMTDSSR